jgi:hypothetical protein
MNRNQFRTLTGFFLILVPILLLVANTILSRTFNYPKILRKSTIDVLSMFRAGGSGLVATWYVFMLAAILLIPLAVMLHSFLSREDTPYMNAATTIGVLAGVVQFLGLIRWTFLVPYLTRTYFDPASSQGTREAVIVVFQTFNHYAGVAIGEHLGYLFSGLWTLSIALAMRRSRLFKPWLGCMGIIPALGIFAGLLEPLGFRAAVAINGFGYALWAVWAFIVGVFLLRRQPQST